MEFELRRAEPGQEFTYTTTDRTKLDEGEDAPEGARIEQDVNEDGEATRYAVREGVSRTIRADDKGIVTPRSQEDVNALDLFDLPVARKAIAERQAETKAEEKPEA